jgi:hypothetical protein
MARSALSFEEFHARFLNEAACADHESTLASKSRRQSPSAQQSNPIGAMVESILRGQFIR